MSDITESAFEYFEYFLIGMKEHYDSLLAEIKMATYASVIDYESIGTRFGFVTVMQIVAENGNNFLSTNFENLSDEGMAILCSRPEAFIGCMIDEAGESCALPKVQDQVKAILKRDYAVLDTKRTMAHFQDGVEKAVHWLHNAIDTQPEEEHAAAVTDGEPIMIVR